MVVAAAGFQGDVTTLMKVLKMRHVTYQHNHGRPMGSKAVAQLMMNTLYSRRFFPYYSFTIVAGLDDEGALPFLSTACLGVDKCIKYLKFGSQMTSHPPATCVCTWSMINPTSLPLSHGMTNSRLLHAISTLL